MADDPTTGEVYRRLQDHEQRSDRQHSDLDQRITRMAAESVPLDVWHQAERARDAEMSRMRQDHEADMVRGHQEHDADLARFRQDVTRPLGRRLEAVEKRLEVVEKRPGPTMTFSRWMAVITAVITALGVVVAAYAASKGAHQ